MKFRQSQHTSTLAKPRPIEPSLLSDPAFSTDPYSHPFAVTDHEPWLISPPAGHPFLKKKSRRVRNRILVSSDSDSEPFPLIQPPNSPVSFGDADKPPTIANSKDMSMPQKSKERHSLPALSLPGPRSPTEPQAQKQSHQVLSLSLQPPLPPASNTPTKGRTLMTFLKRRSSQQPESPPTVVDPKPKRSSTLSATNRNDVTRPSASRQLTEPNLVRVNRPVLSERPVNLDSSMPTAPSLMANGSSAAKRHTTDGPVCRVQDLDRIDELDESSPWGIALHHGGPYEAAVQAIRKREDKVFAGYGSYHRGVPQPSDRNYLPPQATGLSLNLIPGQILPRNVYAYNPSAPTVAPPTAVMMRPSGAAQSSFASSTPSLLSAVTPNMQSSVSLPLASRPQSYQPPTPMTVRDHPPRRQSYDPQPSITPHVNMPSLPPTTPKNPHLPQRRISPTPETQNGPPPPHKAILEPPSRNPPKLEIEDLVTLPRLDLDSIGIGMAMFQDDSDDDSKSSASELFTSRNVSSATTPDEPLRRPSPLKVSQPELTSSSDSVQSQLVATKSATQESLQSPSPYASPTSSVEPQRSQVSIPSQSSSKGSIPGLKPSTQPRDVAHMALHVTVEAEVIHQVPIQPSFTPSPSNPSSDSLHRAPARRSQERVQFEDTASIHPSFSTQSSSSQSRSSMGPPPSRHIPKRLVMPAPLAQQHAMPSLPQHQHFPPPQAQTRPPRAARPPPRVIPRVPVPVLSPMHSSQETMLPTIVKAQAQEIHFAASKVSKLKKRVSLITAPPMTPIQSAPIVTTVSFAPPVIDFENPVVADKKVHKMMTEEFVPRRVLSKRTSY